MFTKPKKMKTQTNKCVATVCKYIDIKLGRTFVKDKIDQEVNKNLTTDFKCSLN